MIGGVGVVLVDSVVVVCLSQETWFHCDSLTQRCVDLDTSVVFVFSCITSVKVVALNKHSS